MNTVTHSSPIAETAKSVSPSLSARLAALPRDTRDTLFLLAVVAWILLPQIGNTPWWTSALAASVLLWRAWLAVKARPLPKRWVLAGLLILAVAATWLSHRTLVGKDAGVTLIVLLLTLKTLEMRARRDAMVVFFLGFFTLLSNFFYSQSLLTALAMIVGLMGLLTALVNAHMTAGRPPLLQALRTAGLLVLWGTPVMIALFLLFPRMAPLWGMPTDELAGRTGLSENMKVGAMASLAMDESVALRLRFDSAEERPVPPDALYFRGPVLSRFDGQEWQADPMANALEKGELRVSGAPVRYTMTVEPSKRHWLTMLDAVAQTPQAPPGAVSGRIYRNAMLQWLTQRPITDVLRVEAASHINFSYGPLENSPELNRYRMLPSGTNARTLEMARQMRYSPELAKADTQTLVNAALQKLRTGDYTYTFEPGVVDNINTADDFWFDSKEGFCEHISSAFAVLMRGMDIPARIVTGYQGGDLNPVDGYWTVRNSDAHAWVEVWMQGRGWVRVDPTGAVVPGRIGQTQRLAIPRGALASAMGNFVSPGTLQQLRAAWEAVNNRWNQWILNYSQSRQLSLLESLGIEAPSWTDLLRLIAGFIGLSALLWLAWDRLTRKRQDEWTRLMEQARRKLELAGFDAGSSTPARALAQQVSSHWQASAPEAAQAIARWLIDMERLRYAPGHNIKAELPQMRKRWRALYWPKTANPPQTLATAP